MQGVTKWVKCYDSCIPIEVKNMEESKKYGKNMGKNPGQKKLPGSFSLLT